VGTIDEDLIYLDPHHLQPTSGAMDAHSSLETYSSEKAERISISSADPSLCLGFFCASQTEFDGLLARLQQQPAPGSNHLFSIVEKSLAAMRTASEEGSRDGGGDLSDDDFELI
jgi:cysteine protease ATG4